MQIFELLSIGRVTLDAFVGHEGHDCTLEVGRRDEEKLRERFSSSHGFEKLRRFCFFRKEAKPIVSALVYILRSSSHFR